MLTKFLFFSLFSWLLGNPFLALLLMLLLYYTIDRTFWGFIPDPFKTFKRAGRIRELQKIVSINPSDARSLKELGIFMIDKREYESARKYFEKAAQKMADDPEFNYYYGLSVARCGDREKGRQLLDAALKTSPGLKYGEPFIMFAEVYSDSGDYRSALNLLERFEKIHSSSSRGFYQLGYVKLKLGMNAEGAEYLKKAIAAFKASPRFKRKQDRKWAWKARALLRRTP